MGEGRGSSVGSGRAEKCSLASPTAPAAAAAQACGRTRRGCSQRGRCGQSSARNNAAQEAPAAGILPPKGGCNRPGSTSRQRIAQRPWATRCCICRNQLRLHLLHPAIVRCRAARKNELWRFLHPLQRGAAGGEERLHPFPPAPHPCWVQVGVSNHLD
ncbi:MAG: hypothetical protein UZ07_CHB004002990 [Chlorobi bacterium OLB7]|nr:MAG: hypothetical protein UZ07_CHB004002990 [Chlorobi bacterium OLB7]